MSPKSAFVSFTAFIAVACFGSLVYFWDRYEPPVTREQALSFDMKYMAKLMELYKLKYGDFPTVDQGVRVLTEVKEERHKKIESQFLDPWGEDYRYNLYQLNEQYCYIIWSEKLGKERGYNSCEESR